MSTVTSPFPGSTNSVFVVFLTTFHSRTQQLHFNLQLMAKVGTIAISVLDRTGWGLQSVVSILSSGVSDSDWGPVCVSGNNQPVRPVRSLSPPSPLRSIYPRSEPSYSILLTPNTKQYARQHLVNHIIIIMDLIESEFKILSNFLNRRKTTKNFTIFRRALLAVSCSFCWKCHNL